MRGRGMKFHMGGVTGEGGVFVAIVDRRRIKRNGPGTAESTYEYMAGNDRKNERTNTKP